MTRVSVKPELLRWARERSGMSYSDLVAKFKKLPAWESGKTLPTLKQLESFARINRHPHLPFIASLTTATAPAAAASST